MICVAGSYGLEANAARLSSPSCPMMYAPSSAMAACSATTMSYACHATGPESEGLCEVASAKPAACAAGQRDLA